MGNQFAILEEISPDDEKKVQLLQEMEKSREIYLKKVLKKDKIDGKTTNNDSDKDSGEMLSERDKKLKSIDPKDYDYPFEHLVFEGGGCKCTAYGGAVSVLEECGILKKIKRFGGASGGASAAAYLAMGYDAEELKDDLSWDMQDLLLDAKRGFFSLLPNLLRGYGWNPGVRIYERFGDAIATKTKTYKDLTFYELYKLTGKELCVIVTNLNTMSEEYCHVKTTPNMPIRAALRMSISVPGLFQPVQYTSNGETNVYVDGGVLCNYPIHCFDGWWLSMEQGDSFFERLNPLEDIPKLLDRSCRFERDPKDKTLGLLVYEDKEMEVFRFFLDSVNGKQVEYPSTKLSREKRASKVKQGELSHEHRLVKQAVEEFLSAIDKNNLDGDDRLCKSELYETLHTLGFKSENFKLLFGEDATLDTVFDVMDRDGNGTISYNELTEFIKSTGVSLKNRFIGYNRTEIDGVVSFFGTLQNTVLANLEKLIFQGKNLERTVGINTGYIGTADFKLEEADREFIFMRGRQAMESFLKNYVLDNNLQKRNL